MNKRPQTFSATRPLSAQCAPLQPKKNHPMLKKVPLGPKEEKKDIPRPEWNSNLNENPHKISRAEVLQRKLNAKSKHELAAREELQVKLDSLKAGKVPEEYKPFTNKGIKKFSANEAFIMNKDLKKEYENRCYTSTQDQSFNNGSRTQRQLGDPISMTHEAIQIKTQAFQQQPLNTTASIAPNFAKMTINSIQQNNYTQQLSTNRDFEHLIGMIHDTKKELKIDQTSSEDEDHNEEPEMAGESQYIEVPHNDSNTQNSYQAISSGQANLDYLDYRENEERLERLRSQNFELYSNFLEPSQRIEKVINNKIEVVSRVTEVKPIQINVPKLSINFESQKPAQQKDDLDVCFQNLNNLLGQSSHFNSEITPIKPELGGSQAPTYRDGGIETSPSSLMPQYGDLMIGYSRQPLQIKKPEEVLYYPKQQQPTVYQRQYPEQDDDPEITRMRDMLLNTQQEIDKIIMGTEKVSDIYNQSKQYTNGPSLFQSQQTSAVIRGNQPLNDVSLAPVHYSKLPFTTMAGAVASSRFQQENVHPNIMYHKNEDEELMKPRAYPFQQYQDPNSVSLRTNVVVVPPTYQPSVIYQKGGFNY